MDFQFINDVTHRSEFQQEVLSYVDELKNSPVDSIQPHKSKMVAAMATHELQVAAGSDKKLQREYLEKGCRVFEVNCITDDLVSKSL